jgi:hypothetical protein
MKMNEIIQEAVMLSVGQNFVPNRKRYRLPNQSKNASVYLLSNSYEYDVQMIRNCPQPKIEYKNIIIPYRVMDRIGVKPFRFMMTQNEYNKRVIYLNNQKLIPKVVPINFPYPKKVENNVYISISEIIDRVNTYLRPMSVQFIRDNIFDLFLKVMNWFNFSQTKVLLIDTTRYPIYRNMTIDVFKSDLINALLASYMLSPKEKIKRLNWVIVFRTPDADYKFDLSQFRDEDKPRLRTMFGYIGTKGEAPSTESEEGNDVVDNFTKNGEVPEEDVSKVTNEPDTSNEEDDGEETPEEIKNFQRDNSTVTKSLKSSIDALSAKYGIEDNGETPEDPKKKLNNAKITDISAQLMQRINRVNTNPATEIISTYKTVSSSLTSGSENDKVENDLIDNAVKNVAQTQTAVDTTSVDNTVSSAREMKIRKQVGKVKLGNVTFDTLVSVTDTPLPTKITPRRITTTSKSALAGSSFSRVSKEYEDKLMSRDIVATFMNMSELPNGFYVTNVDVTDISTSTSLMDKWTVTLKNKQHDRQQVINVYIPKVKNGRFYNNGIWYNIGKQDFPIPILKVNKKKVILTTNYNKITVERYDTRSLVDIGMFTKTINTFTDENGKNKYIRPGSSVGTNGRFVSTIEYDEYAKQWYSFTSRDSLNPCTIYFDRQKCLKQYGFVTVNEDEFCCGMLGETPIVVNVETGLTRSGQTLTAVMLSTLPSEVQEKYRKMKPGKMSMYSQIVIGETMPLGVAVAAWEGLSSLIKKSGVKAQYVDKNFSDTKFLLIPFKDKTLAIPNTIQNQLLFNGFYRINTKAYNTADFEIPISNSNSVFVDIFNQHFFRQYSQLTLFTTYYDFFVDAITKDVCLHYNIPTDICGMLIYSSNLLADNGYTMEMKSSLYRIRSSEIIPAILHYRLAFALSKYNNSLGSKSRGAKMVFNPNEVIMELMKVPTVEPMSALNPFVELHLRENISRKGFKGVNSERTFSVDKRSFDESMVGKMAISSPNNAGVGITRQLTVDPKIESVRGYTSTKDIEGEYNDLQLSSWSELLTPGTVSRDEPIRNAIATSQTSHIVQTEGAQPCLISNGIDEILPAHLTDEFAVMAEADGTVIEIADDYMIVQYKGGKKKAIDISHRQSFNTGSGFYVDNKLEPNFQQGDSFKQNDILAYHKNFFSKDSDGIVRANIGPVAKVAFTQAYNTYEDAGIMTAKFSKKMATTLTMRQIQKIDATDDIEYVVKVGDEVEIDDPLIVYGLGDTGDKSVDNFLRAFQSNASVIDSAKRTVKAKHAGRVVDVRMYTCKSLDKLSPSLYKLLSDHFKENLKRRKILDKYDKSSSVYKLDTLYSRPTEPIKGTSIKGITTDVLIEIYIEHEDEQSIGDKAVAYGAMKQITSELIPEGLEPYSESNPDEEVSMFISGCSILTRMVPSVLILAAGNKVLIETKRKMKRIWESEG